MRESCSAERHEALKLDRAAYEAETYPIGWQDMGDGMETEYRNHTVCNSTLCDGTERQRIALREAA